MSGTKNAMVTKRSSYTRQPEAPCVSWTGLCYRRGACELKKGVLNHLSESGRL